jgi:putative aldouronate transport system permease protein
MMIPAAFAYITFRYVPIWGILMAFEDYNIFDGILHSKWVGLAVLKEVVSQKTFWRVFASTLRLNLLSLAFGFPTPILFALLLNEITRERFKRIVQTISYMPHFISWVIVYGMLLAFVSADTGLFNFILKSVGLPQIKFLMHKTWWFATYIGTGIWKEVGFSAIMYVAAMTAINPELYEAADIDGAGRFGRMWHITLPGIKSTIVILLILHIGNMVTIGFDQPYLMGNAVVMGVSDVLSTYIYRNGIQQAQFSFTTAVGLFQSVVNFVLVLSANGIANRLGEGGLFGKAK